MNLRMLLRMKRLAQRPPSARRVALVLGVVAASMALYGLEQMVGWPDWLTPNTTRNTLSAKP